MSGYCKCPVPKPRPSGAGKQVCVNQNCHKEMRVGGESGDILAAKKAEIEIIERKLKSAIALCEEGLNRLQELKAL